MIHRLHKRHTLRNTRSSSMAYQEESRHELGELAQGQKRSQHNQHARFNVTQSIGLALVRLQLQEERVALHLKQFERGGAGSGGARQLCWRHKCRPPLRTPASRRSMTSRFSWVLLPHAVARVASGPNTLGEVLITLRRACWRQRCSYRPNGSSARATASKPHSRGLTDALCLVELHVDFPASLSFLFQGRQPEPGEP